METLRVRLPGLRAGVLPQLLPALMSPMLFCATLLARAARTCLPWPPAERWYASILPACPCVPLPLLVPHETSSLSPSPHGVLLTVCLLSPCSQDSCSQDLSTEMVGCPARLMPGLSFSWRSFSACSGPDTLDLSSPWGVGTTRVCCNEGQPHNEIHFGAAKLGLS